MERNPSIPDYRTFKRAIVYTVSVLILFIIGFSLWKASVEYQLTLRAAELQSRGYARALKEHADRAFGEADNILLDTIEQIKGQGGIDKENSSSLSKLLNRYPRSIPQVGAIFLVNKDGQMLAHTLDINPKQFNFADREYFLHHRTNSLNDTPFLSRPVKSRVSGKWRFYMSRPVRSANGSFEGLVAVAFEMEYFQKFYASLDLGKKGRIVILRKDGVMLLSQPFKESDFSADFKKSFLYRHYLPKAASGTFLIDSGKALLESKGRMISYETLDSFPVVVSANLGIDEVTAAWRGNTFRQGFITLAACLALVTLTVMLLRQIRGLERAYQRQLEQHKQLVQASSAWRSTFDSVADAIWVMDLERRIQRCNKASESILGKNVVEVVGHHCCAMTHPGYKTFMGCPFEKMLDSGQRASAQIEREQRWYEVTVDPIFSVAGELTGAVHIAKDITDSRMAEERYRLLVDNLPVVTWEADQFGKTYFVSSVSTKIEGYTPEEICAGGGEAWFDKVHPEDQPAVVAAYEALFKDGAAYDVQYRLKHKAGHWIWLHDTAFATSMQNGVKIAHGVFNDVTARKQAEDERDQLEVQLRQAQKMEAIGHLAGGIAHDFNNLLTPIMGYTEMAVNSIPANDPLLSKLSGILAAANKAKDLTQQLLSFGRRQTINTQTLDLNQVILSFNDILRRTIRESIHINLLLDPEGSAIKADRSQIEQIILNLTVNAQDAFNGGHGRINIETCRVWMDGENARLHPGMAPGEYVLLSFRDNGCGMSAEVANHIFEPFFTTKPVGHGTGLGLATVYGIVKQHDAHISVSSHEGEGTTFTIYFRSCAQLPLLQPQVAALTRSEKNGLATILLVEDNEMVRKMVQEMLEGLGYVVIVASGPDRAIELFNGCSDTVDLLVSDVVMPGMNGPELYEQLVTKMPSLKVVYISGYPRAPGLRETSLGEDINYLQKPFTSEALQERIRQVL